MKCKTTVVLGAITWLTFSVGSSQAQNCNSAARVVSDLWAKTHSTAIAIGCVPASAVATAVSYAGCVATSNLLSTLTTKLVQFWNTKANSSWATIGPRRLDFNKNLTGTLVSTGGRVFVSFPVLNANRVKIIIDETGGKGKTSVVVCKANRNNRHTKVATKWFNDTRARKNKTNEHREITINGAKNHIITVHLDGKSVGNTFKYKIRGILIDFTGAG